MAYTAAKTRSPSASAPRSGSLELYVQEDVSFLFGMSTVASIFSSPVPYSTSYRKRSGSDCQGRARSTPRFSASAGMKACSAECHFAYQGEAPSKRGNSGRVMTRSS